MKRYKSSKGRKAKQEADTPIDEPASESEDKDDDDDDDASDGDEYVGERGEEGSDAEEEDEDAAMEEAEAPSSSARSQRHKPSDADASSKVQGTSKDKGKSPSTVDAAKPERRRASESLRRPSATHKPASGSKKTAPRKPVGPTDASTEEARSRARKVLATALEKIFSSNKAKLAQIADNDEEETDTDDQLAEAYAALLEEELFETNADAHGSIRVVGTKYKDRFRTFLFSLKDAKNTTLHSRIASGELTASELAKMSNDELANDSIRQATEKARLEALHRSTLRAEEAGPMRKITHKGEIEIESDALVARDQPGKFQKSVVGRSDAERPPATRVSESEPAVSSSAGDQTASADADRASPADDVTRRSAPAPSLAQGSPTRLNFGDVWTKNAETRTQDNNDNENHSNDEPQESFGFDMGSPHEEMYDPSAAADADNPAASGADDFIDSFLDGPDQSTAEPTSEAPQASSNKELERSTTPDGEPPSSAVHRYRRVLWNGLIDLPDVFAFQGHVKQVAGRSLASASRVWSKFFPERPLLVAGRLPSKAAIDYLLQVVNAPRTEILAFTMEPGASRDGIAQPQDSDQASFEGMLGHFKKADRWGALHVSSSVKGSLIKDFYAVPLSKDDEVPLWLDMAESDCLGADWHKKRDRDLLVLVAVVIRDALQVELTRAERSEARQRSASNQDGRQRQDSHVAAESGSAPDEAYDPTAGLSIPLGKPSATVSDAVPNNAPPAAAGFGSDALQSLLRTLGKTSAATPSNMASVPGSSGSMPAGVLPPGPPPPGPPPGPPPAFAGIPPPAGATPPTGSWSPHPAAGGDEAAPPQQWGAPHAYAAQPPYGYGGAAESAGYGHGGGWGYEANMHPPHNATPPQPQEVPEEEYPGQYNPEFLAQASAGAARGGAGFGGRGRGQGYGHHYGHGRGRGGGGWNGGRGW